LVERCILTHLGWALVHQQKYEEAETILNDAVLTGFYNKIVHPEDEIRYSWAGLLGATLVTQKKYAAAESRLLDSYNGRIHRKLGEYQLDLFTAQEAVKWLMRLHDEWGKPDEAAKWPEKLEALREECRRREALALKPPRKSSC